MRLTEAKVVELIQEAYDKRLNYYLTEKMDVKNMGSLENADMLKIRRVTTGAEYTFGGVVNKDDAKEGGEGVVVKLYKLYLPDEPRMSSDELRQRRFIPEVDEDVAMTSDVLDEDNRDYILVDEKTFDEEFELA